ncbi:60S ribosomal protein L13a [Armadillidium nasatum]|uniref:Large ribosomal subunit protein uL13 n=1 Tax=Armadillidium nasatum TaxID=96803 RepID=A0A5N5TGB4_9CRUS|nr:60S ribosomal protein L13a [Armadillidium nasatum]
MRSNNLGQLGFSKKPIIIDGHHHMVGRLASIVAKMLLDGQRVVVLRCEDLNYSGSFFRNRLKYLDFLHKRCNVNPKRGPFHHRAPAKIFQRTVRGMLPIKIRRGKEAYRRLKVFEGVPPVYVTTRKMMVPEALRALRMKPGNKFCSLGRLSHLVGWKYQDVVASLETKRKVNGKQFARKKLRETKLSRNSRQLALKYVPEIRKIKKSLNSYGSR